VTVLTHKAKIDWWIAAAILLGIAAPLAGGGLWMTVPLFLAVGICGYPQYYRTTKTGLVVRAGLMCREIPYAAIRGVAPEGGRVRVEYGANAGLDLVPADSRAFVADVAAHAR
jgi:hypothetical protein